MKDAKELFSTAANLSYEWSEFYVYRHPREARKYIVDTGYGCSCNIYEAPSLAAAEAMTPLGKREVYAAFSQWWDSIEAYDHYGTKVDTMERLRSSL